MSLGFLAPQFLWALLALPVVVALHFLRTRRRSKLVSALFLWRTAREAAERKRRFSPTWLLALQLLFTALAALALARPVITTGGAPDRVIVIDASASMLARDSEGVRLDRARRIAERLVAGGGRTAIVRAGLDATVLSGFDASRAQARRALQEFEAGDRGADLARAVGLAVSLAEAPEIHVISDGPSPGGAIAFHPVVGDAVNYGIVTFDAGIGQAYLAVASNDARPQELELQLLQDGREIARTNVLVPGSGQIGVTFPLDAEGVVEARLLVPEGDGLALDDVAFAGRGAITVAVEEDSAQVMRALRAIPGVEARLDPGASTATDRVRVLFGDDPAEIPPGDVLLFAAPAAEPVYSEIRDWNQADPTLRFVDLRDTLVGLAPDLPSDDGEGWTVLARTQDLTPVIARRSSGTGTVFRISFHPSQTDLVLRPAFPALLANIVGAFRGDEAVPLGRALPAGSTYDGRPAGMALAPGRYETPDGAVWASLLSLGETRLTPPDLPAEPAGAGSARPGGAEVDSALGFALVLAASAALLLEWLAWSRGRAGWLRGS